MDFSALDAVSNDNAEPSREDFDRLASPQELHYIAENHNWDSGSTVLQWIAQSPLCSEATALMIFWRAQPYDFTGYGWNAKPKHNGDVFALIKTVMQNFQKGFYQKTAIRYDPKGDMPKEIPEIVFAGSGGEEPYIYYDAKDSFTLQGDYLEGSLSMCNDSMELYNIVHTLRHNVLLENHKNILEHRHCDKGIALFIFWKLKCYNYDEGYIADKVLNGGYEERIKYTPDDYRKGKWEIPEIMKLEVK
ncbi:MAG: DUF4274 domain-containing protein [Spirochaetes bacterium]|nr:DUF4274 domain-containing protein [Spirochaetota bacterium]